MHAMQPYQSGQGAEKKIDSTEGLCRSWNTEAVRGLVNSAKYSTSCIHDMQGGVAETVTNAGSQAQWSRFWTTLYISR